MQEKSPKNISEFFLIRSIGYIKDRRFNDAASLIMLAVTELNEPVNVMNYLSNNFIYLSLRDQTNIFEELIKEIRWLNSKIIGTRWQRHNLTIFSDELFKYLIQYCKLLLKSLRIVGAIKIMQKLFKLKPFNISAFYSFGVIFLNNKKYNVAEKFFKIANWLEPNDLKTLSDLQNTLYMTGKIHYAETLLERTCIQHPENHIIFGMLADTYLKNKKYDEAKMASQRALDKSKNDVSKLCDLGEYYKSIGNYNEAEKVFETAIELDPDNHYILTSLYTISLTKNKSPKKMNF